MEQVRSLCLQAFSLVRSRALQRLTFQQILKLPALERDGARNLNPQPFYDKI